MILKTFEFYPKQGMQCSQSKRPDGARSPGAGAGGRLRASLREGGSVLLGLAMPLLVVALNGPSQRLLLDQITHSHIRVAAANCGATGRDQKIKSGHST